MDGKEILDYCLKKHGAYLDYPFGEIPICVKVKGRLFAQLYPKANDYKITLKCEPMLGDFYRTQYPGAVTRGYHCPPVQQPYWNTVYIGKVPEEALCAMMDEAYKAVVRKLPRRLWLELQTETEESQ